MGSQYWAVSVLSCLSTGLSQYWAVSVLGCLLLVSSGLCAGVEVFIVGGVTVHVIPILVRIVSSVFFFVTGIVSIVSAGCKTRHWLIVTMMMSIISMVSAGIMFSLPLFMVGLASFDNEGTNKIELILTFYILAILRLVIQCE